jgi:hypothetical protein
MGVAGGGTGGNLVGQVRMHPHCGNLAAGPIGIGGGHIRHLSGHGSVEIVI